MSDSENTPAKSTPWHIWVVGVLGVLWSSIGAFDYVMSQTRNEAYLAGFDEATLNYFFSLPSWVIALWAIAVWGGVIGSALILFKKKAAVGVLLASFVCLLTTDFYNYVISNGLEVMGDTSSLVFAGIIAVVSFFLYRYAKAQLAAGVLS